MDQNGGNGGEKLTYQSNNSTEHLTDREDNVNQDPIKIPAMLTEIKKTKTVKIFKEAAGVTAGKKLIS